MQPLSLNSPNWALLEDGYGAADQLPQLLVKLKSAKIEVQSEALDELIDRLAHQMSVYSASIAAFPHLISFASKPQIMPNLRADALCLAGTICESQNFEQVLDGSEFADAAVAVLPIAIDLAKASLKESADQDQALYLLKSIAAFGRKQALARVLDGFAIEEFVLACPSCSVELYVWPCAEGLFVAAEDPVRNKEAIRSLVAANVNQKMKHVDFGWLEQHALETVSLAEVWSKLPFLFGQAVCPNCKHEFLLFNALAEQA